MKTLIYFSAISSISLTLSFALPAYGADYSMVPTPEDKKWLLPESPPYPADNAPSKSRVELGKMLFFDPRLSGAANMSCATCHNPSLGWSDGLPTAKGVKSQVLGRATPTVINTAYNSIQMWDGRKKNLEQQATGPLESPAEMAMDMNKLVSFLNSSQGYKAKFQEAYPGEPIDTKAVSKAIASFERTVISRNSPFDQWLRGDAKAMTASQIRGFRLFADQSKGNCTACHHAPNFTDNGFHNLGLASYDAEKDAGRYSIVKHTSLKGAFKTPTLRNVADTAPYFHDGSARTLTEVMDHYNRGGVSKTDLSGLIRPLNLSPQEVADIVAFMQALSSKQEPITLPVLPQD